MAWTLGLVGMAWLYNRKQDFEDHQNHGRFLVSNSKFKDVYLRGYGSLSANLRPPDLRNVSFHEENMLRRSFKHIAGRPSVITDPTSIDALRYAARPNVPVKGTHAYYGSRRAINRLYPRE